MQCEPLWPHRPVGLEILGKGRPAPVPALDTPARFLSADAERPIGPKPSGSAAWQRRQADWEVAVAVEDIDRLWEIWSEVGEEWLVAWTGKTEARYRGRSRRRRRIFLPPRRKDADLQSGAAVGAAGDWLHLWRWLRDLRRQVSSDAAGAPAQIAALVARLDPIMRRLSQSGCCPSAADLPLDGIVDWAERADTLLCSPPHMLEQWEEEAKARFDAVQRAAVSDRRAQWRDWVQGCVGRRPGLLYRWLRGDAFALARGGP